LQKETKHCLKVQFIAGLSYLNWVNKPLKMKFILDVPMKLSPQKQLEEYTRTSRRSWNFQGKGVPSLAIFMPMIFFSNFMRLSDGKAVRYIMILLRHIDRKLSSVTCNKKKSISFLTHPTALTWHPAIFFYS